MEYKSNREQIKLNIGFNMDKNAVIELKHIQLELENKRHKHLRHFVDQYFCYKNGYVNRVGNPSWELILWKETVSKKAKGKTNRKLVVKEHVVPLKRITQELELLSNSNRTSLEDIASLLDELVIFATITKDEDACLRDAKLTSKMPEEYDQEDHALYKNPYARYIVTGIEYEVIK